MMARFRAAFVVAMFVAGAMGAGPAAPAPGVEVSAENWAAYKAKFLDESGRIVDDANGNISHSEGQGYGMLLAVLAGSRADFDRIWAFTRIEMLLRDDGLSVWKWDPATSPHVSDENNATDGDILIAYALARAGALWERPDLSAQATTMGNAIWEHAIVVGQGRSLLIPGAKGFLPADRDDGPVVNLSYWIFEAFPVLAKVSPGGAWGRLSENGLALVSAANATPNRLPPDWLSLKAAPTPAHGFPPEFGYNALRIPLYMIRAGVADPASLRPFLDGMSAPDGSVRLSNALTGVTTATLTDDGYRIIPALIACVLDHKPVPAALLGFTPTSYYPSTLHLLALSFAARRHPECQ
jgi:endoglucanase